MSVDIKHRRNIVKYKKGEIPKIYDSALTCFETLSYTYDDKGRILKEENSDGSSVSYEYYTWGAVILSDSDIANINPIRYRGCYYDNETSYYYLQSRYYAPEIKQLVIQQNAQLIKQ